MVLEQGQNVYDQLQSAGVDVLWDDRTDARPGEKFADGDLMGIPHRVVISPKTIAAGALEYKGRTAESSENLSLEQLIDKLS